MTAYHHLSMLEQAAAIRRREISPSRLAAHYLERIERLNAQVGAYLTVTEELAYEQARAAEAQLDSAGAAGPTPPLLGVPVAVKDIINVAGVRCTFGSVAYDDFVTPIDDHVVTLMRRAGMVILGKTNTPEFGLACHTENNLMPPSRTPWNLTRSAGGSSGGGAAAVAAGLAPIAQGNDGTGSNRIAAGACGLVGLKPSRGRVSNGPVFVDANSFGLTSHGMVARNVRDCAALLDAIAVGMPGDPYRAVPLPPGDTFLGHCDRDPGRLRVGRHRDPVFAEADVHPECVKAYEDASDLLVSLGHEVEDITPRFDPLSVGDFEAVYSMLALLSPVDPDREKTLMPLTRWMRERGAALSGFDYGSALATTQAVARGLMEGNWEYDVVLTPTVTQPPPPVGAIRNDDDPGREFEDMKRFTPFTALYATTGQPAMNLPVHWTEDGLPVGVMIVGRPSGESLLFSLAAQIEATGRWRDRVPAPAG